MNYVVGGVVKISCFVDDDGWVFRVSDNCLFVGCECCLSNYWIVCDID